MKKITSIIIIVIISTSIFAQRTEHSLRTHSLTLGPGFPIVQKTYLQFEHSLGSNWAIGENIAYHYGLLGSTQIWSGPKLELFGRYYFTDQTIKHGKNWFMQFKGGAALLTNPFASDTDWELISGYDPVTNNPNYILDPNGDRIMLLKNGDNWMSIGGGLAIGYKNISCKGWIFEAFMGYHYWSAPNYFTKEFKEWAEDPQNDYDGDINVEIDDIEDGVDQVWNLTYGFPMDLQIKVGKILNW